MKDVLKLAVLLAVAASFATAIAYAKGPPPNAPLPAKAKAYGRYCQDQSKKHVAGEKGTPFSRCVAAGAKLLRDQHKSP